MTTTAAKKAIIKSVPPPETSKCPHDGLLSYTFTCTGETIRMCPNCTTFDKARRTILGTPGKPWWGRSKPQKISGLF